MGKFLEHILLEKEDNGSSTDPHEIMTACFCLMGSEFSKFNPNGKTPEEMEEILKKLQEIASDTSESGKVIGQNDKEINAILNFSNPANESNEEKRKKKEELRYSTLTAAYSAAANIRKNFNKKVNHVILTGRKWTHDVEQYSGIKNLWEKFGIDSYGMKDFNSSDIILTNKTDTTREAVSNKKDVFLGVSLKKSDKAGVEPTRLNRSVTDAIKDVFRSEENKELKINNNTLNKINAAFNTFYNNLLKTKINEFVPPNDKNYDALFDAMAGIGKYKNFSSGKAVKKVFMDKIKNLSGEEWKQVLSNINGLMPGDKIKEKIGKEAARKIKDNTRDIINTALKRKGSALETLLEILKDQKISSGLGKSLIKIIYKGDLSKLVKYDFEFAVCLGVGSFKNGKGEVDKGVYEPVKTLEETIEKVRTSGIPKVKNIKILDPTLTVSKKQKEFNDSQTAAKLFFDLKIKDLTLANIEIRYKGSYTSSPQFFATMSKEFRDFLLSNEKSKK